MTHADQINKAIRKAGVVWNTCEGCGVNWPFPTGLYATGREPREWRCAVCVNVEWARLEREKQKV